MAVNVIGSERIKKYLTELNDTTEQLHTFATKAREKGFDPETRVDVLLADSVAKRVEGLISAVAPQIVDSGISKRIDELEKKYSPGDWRIGLIIGGDVAQQKFCKFEQEIDAIKTGIRTGLAYITQGVVSAPLEGIVEVKLKKRQDGKDYLAMYFAGPIRGAGGTAQSVSLIIADYVRQIMKISAYDPTPAEVNRFHTEVIDYYEKVERKQYKPTKQEMDFIITHLAIEINGDPTSQREVSNYKNLPRVETNRIRGGLALVLTDGLPLKAEKLWKQLSKWQTEFNLDWGWLHEFIKLKKKTHAGKKEKIGDKLTPNNYYISEIVAGRPVLGYPLEKGGFRLRYGRSRCTGDGSWAISPITMHILNDYIAIGTQLRVERPGKSTALTSCDYIDGPIVKLKDDSVVRVETIDQAKSFKNKIKEILFVGDLLISHGDFSEQGNFLVPPGYCEEWWGLELEKALESNQRDLDPQLLQNIKEDPIKTKISLQQAVEISKKFTVPLHPYWTFHWKDLSKEDYQSVVTWFNSEHILDEAVKRSLELAGIPHRLENNKIIFDSEIEKAIAVTINNEVEIRDKSGTFIGCRMGRPEKAKRREMKGRPQVLFPVGTEGGRLRSLNEALKVGTVNAQFPLFECEKCKMITVYAVCPKCNEKTVQWNYCNLCKKLTKKETCHGPTVKYNTRKIDVNELTTFCRKKIGMSQMPTLIKGVRGTSNKDHYPEYLGKGLLRSKHGLTVNKDGTIRYDMTELGITHFTPEEIGLPIDKAKQFGYTKDIKGKELVDSKQIIEIFPQDIILPSCPESADEGADIVLRKVADFVDEELKTIYGLDSFYNIKTKADLIGQLIIGLSPHTSAGIVGRIIGFSKTQGCFAHPYWHAAQRRDLDGEETSIMLMLDSFLNFSRQYLPDRRGSRSMDAPLVLSTILNPLEVDDEVYDVDSAWRYPLEFYEAALEMKNPWDTNIEQIRDRIRTEKQYEGIGFTHNISNMNLGVRNSAYKSIPTMVEKLEGQIDLAKRIRAVHLEKVAQLVIEGHFIRDIKGNLRKFTIQSFRCTHCNTIFRRPPISGRCSCKKGNIVFTIAEGTVKKYLEATIKLGNFEGVSPYIKQTLLVLQHRVESVFGKEKTKQISLGGFV